MPQLFALPSMQPRRDGECRVHACYASVEIEFGHTFKAAGRTFLDAHAATFAVVDQDLIQPVGALGTNDAWLRTDQITVVARVTGAATETAASLLHRLLLRKRLNDFRLRSAPACGGQHRLLNAWEVREIRHVQPVQIEEDVNRYTTRLE